MKHRLLVAFLALGVAACDDNPLSQADAGAVADTGAPDAVVPADTSPPDASAPDRGSDASGADLSEPAPDSAAADGGASDLAAAPDLGPAASDGSAVGGPTCGPASREMLCATYCDGIGRFCTRADTQFRNADECRTACNAPTWACGKQGETTGNTLFCRLTHMALAGVGDAVKECPNAGPSSPTCR